MATKKQVTLTHESALFELRTAVAYGQFAQNNNCPSVAKREYEFAQRLATFFWHLDLISEEEWNLIWDNISEMKINGKACNEGLYLEEVIL